MYSRLNQKIILPCVFPSPSLPRCARRPRGDPDCVLCLNDQVLYWTDGARDPVVGRIRVSGNVTSKTLTGLKANTVYFASVRAYNTGGAGPSSPPVNVTTKKSRKYSPRSGTRDPSGTETCVPAQFHSSLPPHASPDGSRLCPLSSGHG